MWKKLKLPGGEIAVSNNRSITKKDRWTAFWLSVAGSLVLLLVIVGGAILIGNTATSVEPVAVSYKILHGYLDLSYSTTAEDISASNNWPPKTSSNVDVDKAGLFVTNDNWQVVRDFYTQKFQKAGFSINDGYGCNRGQCVDADIFSVDIKPADRPELDLISPYHINFVIISANATDAEFTKSTLPMSIRQNLKPNTTLIAFISAFLDDSGFAINPGTPDPLATPIGTKSGS